MAAFFGSGGENWARLFLSRPFCHKLPHSVFVGESKFSKACKGAARVGFDEASLVSEPLQVRRDVLALGVFQSTNANCFPQPHR